tara:strand:+ start:6449 stop:7015 length:567 start_codon:yes stop_codon:yes gene_type:complete
MKAEIRKQILEKRNSLLEEEVNKKSGLIKERLFSLEEFRQADSVLFYVDFGNEVRTREMMDYSVKLGKTVIIPYVKDDRIELSVFGDFSELEKGRFGILEPRKEFIREYNGSIDLVIVPGIAFGPRGYRIGFGGGFYDRLLSEERFKDSVKVALAYGFQVIEKIPDEGHDVKVDKIITEERVISCNTS